MKTLTQLFFGAILICIVSSNAIALTSFDSTYRYKLEMSKDDKVCRHMEKVYKKHFRTPWRASSFPVDLASEDDRARNMFPRLPGLEFNADMARKMLFSRFPSSPEFESIKWREGRYKSIFRSNEITLPVLVADFDIDNDGKLDTVIHDTFFTYVYDVPSVVYPSDFDIFYVLTLGAIDLKKFEGDPPGVMYSEMEGIRAVSGSGLANNNAGWRSIRPFILDGVTFLSVSEYEPPFKNNTPRVYGKSYTSVLKYTRDTSTQQNIGRPSPSEIDTICRFIMIEVHQPSKGE